MMESLLKYFVVKHNIKDVLEFSENSKDVTHTFSINKSKSLQMFFTTVLEYYYKNEINLDYSDSSVPLETKDSIIKNVFPIMYKAKSTKMFDLVDFMFKTFTKVVVRSKTGFVKWLHEPNVRPVRFSRVITPNLDLLFYIIFVNVFPKDLLQKLRIELKIDDLDYKIINRCKGILIRNNARICNIKNNDENFTNSYDPQSYDSIKDKQNFSFIKSNEDVLLKQPEGIMMMLKIFNDLRGFSKRRMDLQDDFMY